MFLEFFDFFCNCILEVFNVMKKFILFNNFTFYHFAIFLMAIPIIFKLIFFIFGTEDEETHFYDNYTKGYISTYDNKKKHSRSDK